MLILQRACRVAIFTIRKPVSPLDFLQWPFQLLENDVNYQIMLWLTYKNFSLKNIDPDFQKQGQSVKPFNITHNVLLTVETNTRPIPSVCKRLSIGQSEPGDSMPVVHKNDSYCKLRPLLLLGKKSLSTCFWKLPGAQDTSKCCISGRPELLQTEITLIKTWTKISKITLMTSTKTLWRTPVETSNRTRGSACLGQSRPHAAGPRVILGDRCTSKRRWDLLEKKLAANLVLMLGTLPLGF